MKDYEILRVKTENNVIEYIKFGEGKKTMAILPGLSLKSVIFSARAIVSAYSLFKKDYTVYLFDRAEIIPDGYDVYAMAQDTASAIFRLKLKDIYLFGVSQGGAIAQVLAVNHPYLIKKLVLASTFSKVSGITEKALNEWVEIAQTGDHTAFNRKMFACIYSEKTLKNNALLLSLLSREGDRKDCERFIKLAKATERFDISDKLGKIVCPTLVLGAENDKIVPKSEMDSIARRIGCEKFIYAGYGHAVYDEAPDFKQRISEFFGEE